jgi:hypothetical protein
VANRRASHTPSDPLLSIMRKRRESDVNAKPNRRATLGSRVSGAKPASATPSWLPWPRCRGA